MNPAAAPIDSTHTYTHTQPVLNPNGSLSDGNRFRLLIAE